MPIVRRLAPALALVALTGCYATHGGEDVGPVDARRVDARGIDAATPTDPDAWVDRFPDTGGDAGMCLCATDADCPPPPPSWNCLASICTGCACAFRLEPERCGPGAVCDATGNCSMLRADANVDRPDVGPPPPPPDAFFVPVDAFVAPVDAFSPDAGRPPSSDALRFATDDVMTVPDRPALSIGPDLTLELWARLRSSGVIAIKGDPSVGSHLYLEARPAVDGVLRTFWVGWSVGGTRVVIEADRPIARDAWTHFAVVQRQNAAGRVEVELYIDGESATGVVDAGDASTYIATFNASPFVIGRTDMDVDEVRLWRVPRGRAAIQGFMRTELMPGISGLAAYWPLDGVGQVVLDRSLNGNDGFRGTSPAPDGADPEWILDGAF